jgi:hypothetical protein
MHDHFVPHEHNLKHCAICDVVYCTICAREWRRFPVYSSNPIWQPYTITYTTGDNMANTTDGRVLVGDHAHTR